MENKKSDIIKITAAISLTGLGLYLLMKNKNPLKYDPFKYPIPPRIWKNLSAEQLKS